MADELASGYPPNQRRQFIEYFAFIGLSSSLLPGVLWAKLQEQKTQKITVEMLREAEEISGVHFTDAQRDMMLKGVNENRDRYKELRQVHLEVTVPPALRFSSILPGMRFDTAKRPFRMSAIGTFSRPSDSESLSFWPVTHLSALIRSRQLSSLELTELYLDRLKRFDPVLKCVVTLTDDLAMKQAKQADVEIKAGHYRGPLHGIPWGAKDLIAKGGYPTTWGAPPFKEQVIPTDATVVERLEKAGAVLVGKLATGELAHDDVWFGGQTKNPWDVTEGSGGSSAGPGSATAAGLVGFAIGTETGGSIIDPAIRCGVTALRPTFGRVSRYGVMPGAWSFDKVGPMCRSVEDCAVVLNAIHGPDGMDLTVVDLPFNWDATLDIRKLRVGYLRTAFQQQRLVREEQVNDEATLAALRSLGVNLREMDLPNLPITATNFASAFVEISSVWDEMVRRGQDIQLTRQDPDHIGNLCRTTQTMPAIEYVRANRIRTLLMEAMAKVMADLDVYVAPQSRIDDAFVNTNLNLWLTNLTGHPAVVVPNGFARGGKPTGITFIGNLYGEGKLLALAKAYQDATEFHSRHPSAFGG
jgi:Asp-tRNA(Asn)/Glu-tRNA(Gln) amidotransferase A subunit family amidase